MRPDRNTKPPEADNQGARGRITAAPGAVSRETSRPRTPG
jgi:hypothetical protein